MTDAEKNGPADRAALGKPADDARIGTSYVERHNGTIRQQIRRFTRKTLAFSKKLRNLRAAIALIP